MDYEIVGIVIVLMTLILAPAVVLILRPISKHAGELLKQMAREREEGQVPGEELERLRRTVELLSDRLQLVEERQDFSNSVLGGQQGEEASRVLEERGETIG